MQLNNTKEDKELLNSLLLEGKSPKAIFSLGIFTSELATSLSTIDYIGEVTSIDMDSGYCNWVNVLGQKMPPVNINCITLKD